MLLPLINTSEPGVQLSLPVMVVPVTSTKPSGIVTIFGSIHVAIMFLISSAPNIKGTLLPSASVHFLKRYFSASEETSVVLEGFCIKVP